MNWFRLTIAVAAFVVCVFWQCDSKAATVYHNTFSSAAERANLTLDGVPAGPFNNSADILASIAGATSVQNAVLPTALTGSIAGDGVLTINFVGRFRSDRDTLVSLTDSAGVNLLQVGTRLPTKTQFDVVAGANSQSFAAPGLNNANSLYYDMRLVVDTSTDSGELFAFNRGAAYSPLTDTFSSASLVSLGTFSFGFDNDNATGIRFNVSGGGTSFDDITIDFSPPVPEPHSVALVLTGACVFCAVTMSRRAVWEHTLHLSRRRLIR